MGKKSIFSNTRLTLSTKRCSHSGRLPGTAGTFCLAHLHSDMHSRHGICSWNERAMGSSDCVNSPFHSLPLTSLLSPLSSSLFPSPSLYPYPFLLSLLCRKCKIECLHKDYVMHFIVLPGNVPCQANITMQLT